MQVNIPYMDPMGYRVSVLMAPDETKPCLFDQVSCLREAYACFAFFTTEFTDQGLMNLGLLLLALHYTCVFFKLF